MAAALESHAADFDWGHFLSGDHRGTAWVGCALVLARRLLGASLAAVPEPVGTRSLPSWLMPAVLEQWGDGSFEPHGQRRPMAEQLRDPVGLLRALRLRWPNVIEASLGVGAPCNEWPRQPFQVGACLLRGGRFVLRSSPLIVAARPR